MASTLIDNREARPFLNQLFLEHNFIEQQPLRTHVLGDK